MIYSINEGQQAEEYKARKAKEAEAESRKYDKYGKIIGGRIGAGNKDKHIYSTDDKPGFRIGSEKDNERDSKSHEILYKELDTRKSNLMNSTNNEREFLRHANNLNNFNSTHNMHAAVDAINRHMRRHPEQYKESYGIFDEVQFLGEASFAGKRKIIKSEDYAKLKELQKKYKEDKNPDTRVQLMEEAIGVIDRLIEAAKSIPADNPLEWIARFIIRQFDDPIRVLWNIMGYSVFKLTAHMTRDDFIQKLYITREKFVEKYEKNRRKIERHS